MTRRIMFFLDSLPVGGAEKHAIGLSKALEARGFETSLLVYSGIRSPSYSDDDLPSQVTILGRGSNNTDLAGWKLTGRAIAASGAEIVFAVNQATLAVAILSRLMGLHNAQVICSFHSTIIATRRGRIRLPLFYALLRRADGIIYVSANQQRYWESRRLWAPLAHCVVNGIDTNRFSPPTSSDRERRRAELGYAADDFVIGLTAQFRPEKNHGQLIEAGAKLLTQGCRAKFLLVGDGICRPAIEQQARALGIEKQVTFTGEQRDVRPFLHAMDVAVLTSKSIETLSLAALEAMASGVPLVLSDIGGASEIVDEGANGYLFPAGDTEKLVERLMQVAEARDPASLRAEARRKAVARFAYEKMVDGYAEILGDFGRLRKAA